MTGLIASFITAVRLYLMRRKQFENLKLRRYFRKRHDVEVGLYSYGCFDRWRMPGPMKVGRYCSFASTVRSALANHPIDALTTHPILYDPGLGAVDNGMAPPEPLVIEDDVWVGHNAMILPGCKRIGRGAVIGAGSIVTSNVDRYAVMAGNPARKIRDRFPPAIAAALEASRWWELDLAELRTLVREHRDEIYHPKAALMEILARRRGQ
jgi:virginiamycin A acetyltransferase